MSKSKSPRQDNIQKSKRGHYNCEITNGVFEGDMVNFIRNGIGILIHDSSTCYIGNWCANQFHGEGLIFFQQGGYIYAQFNQNRIQGFGIIMNGNDCIISKWHDNQVEGKLHQYSHINKTWTSYQFKRGVIIMELSCEQNVQLHQFPQFLITDPVLSRAFSNLLDFTFPEIERRNQHQNLRFIQYFRGESVSYIGFYDSVQKNPNGLGIIVDGDKIKFSGKFYNGDLSGLGRINFDNGDIYEGNFQRNQFEGTGVYYISSQNQYVYGIFRKKEMVQKIKSGLDYPNQLVRNLKTESHMKSLHYFSSLFNIKKEFGFDPFQIFSFQSKFWIAANQQFSRSQSRLQSNRSQQPSVFINDILSQRDDFEGSQFILLNNDNQYLEFDQYYQKTDTIKRLNNPIQQFRPQSETHRNFQYPSQYRMIDKNQQRYYEGSFPNEIEIKSNNNQILSENSKPYTYRDYRPDKQNSLINSASPHIRNSSSKPNFGEDYQNFLIHSSWNSNSNSPNSRKQLIFGDQNTPSLNKSRSDALNNNNLGSSSSNHTRYEIPNDSPPQYENEFYNKTSSDFQKSKNIDPQTQDLLDFVTHFTPDIKKTRSISNNDQSSAPIPDNMISTQSTQNYLMNNHSNVKM